MAPKAPAPVRAAETAIKVTTEPHRSGIIHNQIGRFEDEVLLLENDESTT
jgi:hypothetical protein